MSKAQKIRIFILLFILANVALDAYLSRNRSTDWQETLWVGVYPINVNHSAAVDQYIKRLSEDDFAEIETFFAAEAKRYGVELGLQPIDIKLGDEMTELPPLPPADGGLLGNVWWSLKLRFWANDHQALPNGLDPDIRLYLLYFDPETDPRLRHSLGLQKGLVGIVNLFADKKMRGSNNVIISHEMLHTLGATDKYDYSNGLPVFPQGYAEPQADPLYPQKKAELMAGRIPRSVSEADIPKSLKQTLVGPLSAFEINWMANPPAGVAE